MKKVLIGILLLANLSIFGAEEAENSGNEQNYSTSIDGNYYAIDGSLMGMNLKEKDYFRKKFNELSEKSQETGKLDRKKYIEVLKEYIEKYPNDDFAYEMLATQYMSEGNLKEAEKYCLKAIELGDNDTGYYTLAMIYSDDNIKLLNLTKNEKKEKIKIRDKYVKELTDEEFTHEGLKDIRAHKIAAMNGNAYSIYRLVLHYYDKNNYKLVEKYAKDFLKFGKEDHYIMNALSGSLFAQKKYAEAENILLPFAQKGSENGQYLLAVSYYSQDKFVEAEKWARKALESAKKDNETDNAKIINNLLDEIKKDKNKNN